MPRASKFHLEPKKFEEMNSHLLHLISSLNNKNDINDFLAGFLTKEERIMFAKRLILFMMLSKNLPPSAIKNSLHVSYEMIRAHQTQLSSKNNTFQKFIRKLLKRQEGLDFSKKIDKFLDPIDLIINSKRSIKTRAKLTSVTP